MAGIETIRTLALKSGDSGRGVMLLQYFLRYTLEEQNNDPVGLYGPHTEALVKSFQERAGLTVTGTVGYNEWMALFYWPHPITAIDFPQNYDSTMTFEDLFTAKLFGPNGESKEVQVTFTLDSGAFEPLLLQAVAQELNLPNLGPAPISGVGGSATAYNSRFGLQIGNRTWQDIACVVLEENVPNVPMLFGLRFFMALNLGFTVDIPVGNLVWF